MQRHIDINSDMGEGVGIDEALMPFVSSCSISCGAHAGSVEEIQATVVAAVSRGLGVGAHPAYPDREHFGRRSMKLSPEALYNSLVKQLHDFKAVVEAAGGKVQHVKPHGALYSDVMSTPPVAEVFLDALEAVDASMLVYGMAGAPFAAVVKARGLTYVPEAFADRRYATALQLRGREYEDALIWDEAEAIAQVANLLVDHKVTTVTGELCSVHAQSICIHSDTPGAADLAQAVYAFLQETHVRIGLHI